MNKLHINFSMIITIVALILSIFLFYWFQWRPAQIKKECVQKTAELLRQTKEADPTDPFANYDFAYKVCLEKEGI